MGPRLRPKSKEAGEIDKSIIGFNLVLAALLAVSLLASTMGSAQNTPEAAKFISDKPLFLNLALGDEEAPVVAVAFDETKGTGTGYDAIYLDTNSNGVFEPSEKRAAEASATAPNFLVTLPATLVPGNVTGDGAEKTAVVRFMLYSLGNANPTALVTLNLRLKQGEEIWTYSLTSQGITAATKPEGSPVLRTGPMEVIPTVRPGPRTGVAARLRAGDFSLSCSGPDGASTQVTIRVMNKAGQALHEETVPLGRLGFGWGGSCLYSVGIQPGEHKLQMIADLGLLGTAKAEEELVVY